MFDVIFPKKRNQKYYDIHFAYVLKIFEELKCNITLAKREWFIVTINGKDFLFDYSDSQEPAKTTLPMFKFHCVKETENVFPFPPVSFYDWEYFREVGIPSRYRGLGYVSMRQRPYGNAVHRRVLVEAMLKTKFNVVSGIINQKDYFSDVGNTSLAVFIPGYSENMLDRGHFEYIGLGCCTVSPHIPEILPFGEKLVGGNHYVMCRNNFSDLCSLVDYYQNNPEVCKNIGKSAQELFLRTSTPEAIGKWIGSKL